MGGILQHEIRIRKIEELIPYVRNARTHSEEQVAQIAASIVEFGWTNPILIDGNNGVIAGHGRLLAALTLGMSEVPTLELAHLTEAQKRAYILADNKLALNAGWDDGLLVLELSELGDLGFDLGLTGFSLDDFAALALGKKSPGLTDEDAVPDVPSDPTTKPGDIWLLGRHRIICGSSTEADTVAKVLQGATPHLMVTDPPYGVEYDPSWRIGAVGHSKGNALGKVLNDDIADWREAWKLFPGEVAYIWHASIRCNEVADSLAACGFEIRAQIIWGKNHLVISRGHYHSKHEPCWYAVKKGGTGHWQDDRKQTTLWEINKPQKSETGHSTQKPIECMRIPIENNSRAGDAVYEPFSGSGTTIIACEQTDRICYAVELSPAYVDMAVCRWQEYTGQQATLESDGRTFNEIATVAAQQTQH